jgi:hypothetical protein
MTVTLKPDLEEELGARAQAEGLTTEDFVNRELEKLISTEKCVSEHDGSTENEKPFYQTPEEWVRALDDFIKNFPQHPVLSDEAISRESIYREREDAQL